MRESPSPGESTQQDRTQRLLLTARGGDARALGELLAGYRKFLGTQKRDPRLEQSIQQGVNQASGFLQSGIAGDITSPSQHFARNEAFMQLAAALEALPEDYRQVIVLRHVDAFAERGAPADAPTDRSAATAHRAVITRYRALTTKIFGMLSCQPLEYEYRYGAN